MKAEVIFYALALERCQHALAQLRAVTYIQGENTPEVQGGATKTINLLLESLSRDLVLLQNACCAPAMEEVE